MEHLVPGMIGLLALLSAEEEIKQERDDVIALRHNMAEKTVLVNWPNANVATLTYVHQLAQLSETEKSESNPEFKTFDGLKCNNYVLQLRHHLHPPLINQCKSSINIVTCNKKINKDTGRHANNDVKFVIFHFCAWLIITKYREFLWMCSAHSKCVPVKMWH